MTPVDGVDVSEFQWKQLDYTDPAGLGFVIAKCTQEHTIVDKGYATHLADALAAHVPVGAYHFIGAIGVPAHVEAEWFLEHAGDAQFGMLDVESNSYTGANPLGTLGPNALADWVAEWNSIVAAARPDWPQSLLDYMNRGYATQLVPRIGGAWDLVLATATGIPGGVTTWAGKPVRIEQWGQTTDVPGLGGLNVDRDIADGDWLAAYLNQGDDDMAANGLLSQAAKSSLVMAWYAVLDQREATAVDRGGYTYWIDRIPDDGDAEAVQAVRTQFFEQSGGDAGAAARAAARAAAATATAPAAAIDTTQLAKALHDMLKADEITKLQAELDALKK